MRNDSDSDIHRSRPHQVSYLPVGQFAGTGCDNLYQHIVNHLILDLAIFGQAILRRHIAPVILDVPVVVELEATALLEKVQTIDGQ